MLIFGRIHEPGEQLGRLVVRPMFRSMDGVAVEFSQFLDFPSSLPQLIIQHRIGAVGVVLAFQYVHRRTIGGQGNGKLVYGET